VALRVARHVHFAAVGWSGLVRWRSTPPDQSRGFGGTRRCSEGPVLAHPARSAYGSFLTHTARTGSNSRTRASGRFDPFGALSGNDRYLRQADL
jgi:hypothetical protein